MQHSRGRRTGALLVGLTLAAGAVAAVSGAAGATTEPPGTEPAGTEAAGTEAAGTEAAGTEAAGTEAAGTEAAGTEGATDVSAAPGESGTVEAAPTCTGESDGVLTIATVLPETGNLAFLGPPEFAGAQLAVNDINEAGGVLGQDVVLDQGDSGDTTTDIANQTVDRQLAAGADVFVGAASSGVSSTFIDKLVEACKIQFSPANTSSLFTTYPDDGLYFRTAPPDVLQGQVLADVIAADGITNIVAMALQDPYGEGLLGYVTEDFAAAGGEVLDSFVYDPNASTFQPEVERVIAADPEALVLIGFEESAQILTTLFEAGFTVESGKRIYFVDGNIGNSMGEQLPPGSLEGQKGTTPQAPDISEDFIAAMDEVDPNLDGVYNYGPETYDAIVISALAAVAAGSDDPAQIAAHINGITRDGEKCTTFADCVALIDAGTDIDYDGPAGPMTFSEEGEPSEANYAIFTYGADNRIDESLTEHQYIQL